MYHTKLHNISLNWSIWCRGVTGKFFWGGKVIFPDFFPGVKCFSPVANLHFGRPKTNCRCLEKYKAKKKKKKKKGRSVHFFLPSFFSIFTLFHFSSLFFPDRSAEISQSEVYGRHSAPLLPRLLHHWFGDIGQRAKTNYKAHHTFRKFPS